MAFCRGFFIVVCGTGFTASVSLVDFVSFSRLASAIRLNLPGSPCYTKGVQHVPAKAAEPVTARLDRGT